MRSCGSEPLVYEVHEFAPKRTRYCTLVVVINEGVRLIEQLGRMQALAETTDIIIADGRSTDGSTAPEVLQRNQVRALLITDEPGLSTATRMAYAYALAERYEGAITMDGNGKDGVEAVSDFIAELDRGFDLVQGSRFMKGGYYENTPLLRYIGIRFVMSPLLLLGSGRLYTDPTNAFRACSASFLRDERVLPLRPVFVQFNLHHYLNYRAARLGFRVKEIPVRRVYPADGTVPTKITGFQSNLLDLWEMVLTVLGTYNPRK